VNEKNPSAANPEDDMNRLLVPALVILCSWSASAEDKRAAPAETQRAPNINETVVRYLAAWNERDPKRRRELIARTWAEDGSYIDAHRRGVGHNAIDAMIEKAQVQFPGYQLRLVSGIEAHNGYVRFSWAAGGLEQAPLYIAGTDFATAGDDGRLKSVIGFVDAMPAPVQAARQ